MEALRDKLIAEAMKDETPHGDLVALAEQARKIDGHIAAEARASKYDAKNLSDPPSCGMSPDDFVKLRADVDGLLRTAKRKKGWEGKEGKKGGK